METLNWNHYGKDTPTFDAALDGYETTARVIDCYDGDTMKVVMPFRGVFNKFTCRMTGIDTSEMKGPEEKRGMAVQARNRVLQLIGCPGVEPSSVLTKKQIAALLEETVVLVRVKCGVLDKYGRLLCDIMPFGSEKSLTETLIEEKLGVAYFGGSKGR